MASGKVPRGQLPPFHALSLYSAGSSEGNAKKTYLDLRGQLEKSSPSHGGPQLSEERACYRRSAVFERRLYLMISQQEAFSDVVETRTPCAHDAGVRPFG